MDNNIPEQRLSDSLTEMVSEHENVKRMLVVIRSMCDRILKNLKLDYEDFFEVIDFIRTYTDKHHHGKEEDLLFDRMIEELGSTAEKLIRYGMFVEHDQGRLYVQELEAGVRSYLSGDREVRLDIIANAISYTHLLYRHIDKENKVVYTYAQRSLSKETMDRIDKEASEFDSRAESGQIQKKYLDMLERLENKYCQA